jgi:hypothetical protein
MSANGKTTMIFSPSAPRIAPNDTAPKHLTGFDDSNFAELPWHKPATWSNDSNVASSCAIRRRSATSKSAYDVISAIGASILPQTVTVTARQYNNPHAIADTCTTLTAPLLPNLLPFEAPDPD